MAQAFWPPAFWPPARLLCNQNRVIHRRAQIPQINHQDLTASCPTPIVMQASCLPTCGRKPPIPIKTGTPGAPSIDHVFDRGGETARILTVFDEVFCADRLCSDGSDECRNVAAAAGYTLPGCCPRCYWTAAIIFSARQAINLFSKCLNFNTLPVRRVFLFVSLVVRGGI